MREGEKKKFKRRAQHFKEKWGQNFSMKKKSILVETQHIHITSNTPLYIHRRPVFVALFFAGYRKGWVQWEVVVRVEDAY